MAPDQHPVPAPASRRGLRPIEWAGIVLYAALAGFALLRLATATGGWPLLGLVVVAVPAAWLLVDLLSGLLHWACDTLGSSRTPWLGHALIRPFREHHVDPAAMTRHDFVETHGASCIASLPLLALAAALPVQAGALPWLQALLLFTALGGLASNQAHRWAHSGDAATPRWVRWAQRRGLLLSPAQHRRHHTAPFDSHFCMAGGWLNPAFNAVLRARRARRARAARR